MYRGVSTACLALFLFIRIEGIAVGGDASTRLRDHADNRACRASASLWRRLLPQAATITATMRSDR